MSIKELSQYDEDIEALAKDFRNHLKKLNLLTGDDQRKEKVKYLHGRIKRMQIISRTYKVELRGLTKGKKEMACQEKSKHHGELIDQFRNDLDQAQGIQHPTIEEIKQSERRLWDEYQRERETKSVESSESESYSEYDSEDDYDQDVRETCEEIEKFLEVNVKLSTKFTNSDLIKVKFIFTRKKIQFTLGELWDVEFWDAKNTTKGTKAKNEHKIFLKLGEKCHAFYSHLKEAGHSDPHFNLTVEVSAVANDDSEFKNSIKFKLPKSGYGSYFAYSDGYDEKN